MSHPNTEWWRKLKVTGTTVIPGPVDKVTNWHQLNYICLFQPLYLLGYSQDCGFVKEMINYIHNVQMCHACAMKRPRTRNKSDEAWLLRVLSDISVLASGHFYA